MDVQKQEMCKMIKNNINNLNSNELEEIFKIIYKSNNNYSKNNNGVFVNLSWLDNDTIIKINNYIDFCIKSHNEISKYEIICNNFSDVINNKDKLYDNNFENNETIIKNNKQKVSSYMKFYLLKKKYMKQATTIVNKNEKTLTHEEYLIN
jgi:hypothetical protein